MVPQHNVAAHRAPHVLVINTDTPNTPCPPSNPDSQPDAREKEKHKPTPTNTDGKRKTKNFATTSNELTEAKTQPPEDPGSKGTGDNDQAKLSQPINAHKIMMSKLSGTDSEEDKNNSISKLNEAKAGPATLVKPPDGGSG